MPPGLLPPNLHREPDTQWAWNNAPLQLGEFNASGRTPVRQHLEQPLGAQPPNSGDHLRQSIKSLKGLLQDWEAVLDVPGVQPAGLVTQDVSCALLEALNRLTPAEATAMKDYLDVKQTPAHPAANQQPWPAAAPPGLERPTQPWATRSQGAGRTAPRNNHQHAKSINAAGDSMAHGVLEADSLRTHLHELSFIDSARVVMVRKVNRLGPDSSALLQTHFAKFGDVERVLVNHSIAHQRGPVQDISKVRKRQAPLGFVVMRTIEQAERALSHGAHHAVHSKEIDVQRFQSHGVEGTD